MDFSRACIPLASLEVSCAVSPAPPWGGCSRVIEVAKEMAEQLGGAAAAGVVCSSRGAVGVPDCCSPPSEPLIYTDIPTPFLPDSELVAATGMVKSARALKWLSWRRGDRRLRRHEGKAREGIRKGLAFRITQRGRGEGIALTLNDPTVLGGRKSRYYMPISPRRRRQRIREVS